MPLRPASVMMVSVMEHTAARATVAVELIAIKMIHHGAKDVVIIVHESHDTL